MLQQELPLQRFTQSDLRRLLRVGPRLRDVPDRAVASAIRSRGLRWAIQDDAAYLIGTAITWKASGGTYAITCTSLASGSTRQGAKSSTSLVVAPSGLTTAVMPDILRCTFLCQFTSAPTAGGEVGVYFGFSDSATAGTYNPAGLSGTDAAGPNTDTLAQLTFVGSLVASNNLGTAAQLEYMSCVPLDQYFGVVVYNNTSVAFDATAGHTVLTVVPWYRVRST